MENNNEIWRPVRDYEGRYEVSNLGRVRTLLTDDGKPMLIRQIMQGKKSRVSLSGGGYKVSYKHIRPSVRTKITHKEVGYLVAHAFKKESHQNEKYIRHINGDLRDNRATNLAWTNKRGL